MVFSPSLKGVDEFDLTQYLTNKYYLNKKRDKKIYYRCKFSRSGIKCRATCKVIFSADFSSAKIYCEGAHSHSEPAPIINSIPLSKDGKQMVDELLNNNVDEMPSIIEKQIFQSLEDEELREGQIPSRTQISYRKSKFIHSSFPSRDHIWSTMLSHGSFEGATKFVRIFSLSPLVVVMSTEEGILRLQNAFTCFIDGTHSTSNPTLNLLCLLILDREETS